MFVDSRNRNDGFEDPIQTTRLGRHEPAGGLMEQSFELVLLRSSASWYGRKLVVPAKSGLWPKGKAVVQRLR